jgi:hypothetical protein
MQHKFGLVKQLSQKKNKAGHKVTLWACDQHGEPLLLQKHSNQLRQRRTIVGLEHPYLPLFVFWCSVLCLRTVLGPLHGCGRSEQIGSCALRNGSGTRISDQPDRWRTTAGREWRATIPDSEMSTLRRVLGSPTGPATGAPYTEIGYIAGGSVHSR